MTVATTAGLVREVATAHGAASLAAADHIAVSFSSGGLAFTSKGQPEALTRVEAHLSPARQHVTLTGHTPKPWSVRFADSEQLKSGLAGLHSGSRRLRWQPEDVGTFAAAAIWNYLTLPLLLDQAEVLQRTPKAGGRAHAEGLRRLRIKLPPTIAGHGSVQTVYIGPDGLIRRHDYTATAFGVWARAAQVITDYECFDGVPIGTTRRVTPRVGRPLTGPTLVWIRIHSARLA